MVLTELTAYTALKEHFEKVKNVQMRDLFAKDEHRAEKYTLSLDDFRLDYSKNRITDETMTLLAQLAKQARVEEMRDKMFAGEKINFTEDRAVLHTALRNLSNRPVYVDGKDVMPQIRTVLEKMRQFSEKVRSVDLGGNAAVGQRKTFARGYG